MARERSVIKQTVKIARYSSDLIKTSRGVSFLLKNWPERSRERNVGEKWTIDWSSWLCWAKFQSKIKSGDPLLAESKARKKEVMCRLKCMASLPGRRFRKAKTVLVTVQGTVARYLLILVTPKLGRSLRSTEAELTVEKKRRVAHPSGDETHSLFQHSLRQSERRLVASALLRECSPGREGGGGSRKPGKEESAERTRWQEDSRHKILESSDDSKEEMVTTGL